MIRKFVVLAACLVLGASAEEEEEKRPTIFEALQPGDKYLLLWRGGIHFVSVCVHMDVISTDVENRTIHANISKQPTPVMSRKYEEYYLRTYLNGSSFTLSYGRNMRWRHDFSNFRVNFTSHNKSCFVVKEVTRGNKHRCHDANGCEVWIIKDAVSNSSEGAPVFLGTFDECIKRCPKPQVSLKTLSEISYHPNCTYPENFKPVINGTWQEDVDKLEKEKAEAKKQREDSRDVEEQEDDYELEEQKKKRQKATQQQG